VAERNRRGRDEDDVEEFEDAYDEDLENDDLDEDEDLDEDDEDLDDEDEEDSKPSRRSGSSTALRARSTSKPKADASPGIFGRLVRRFRETVAELQKVIWPTRKELLTYTTVVVVFVAIVMAYVSGLDLGFNRLMVLLFGNRNA
jgi:preprotein translocase subunit SecE